MTVELMNHDTLPEDGDDAPRRSRRSRRLQRHLRRRQDCELNIVSMIDVFAVIVFFLLFGSSISASNLHALKLDIPAEKASSESDTKPLQLTVSLFEEELQLSDRNGLIARLPNNEGQYDVATLSDKLLDIKTRLPDEKHLRLLVAANIAYEHIVAIMDAAREHPQNPDVELFPLIAIGDAAQGGNQP
jgi:biopolymer transport protein ExbD